jgi:hypothetical protein
VKENVVLWVTKHIAIRCLGMWVTVDRDDEGTLLEEQAELGDSKDIGLVEVGYDNQSSVREELRLEVNGTSYLFVVLKGIAKIDFDSRVRFQIQ